MRTTKIYIAGKVTGLPLKETIEKFFIPVKELDTLGFKPINPLSLVQETINFSNEEIELKQKELWQPAMRICIKEMVDCDAVLLLDDWTQSKGALIESQLAIDLGIPRFTNINEIVKHFNENGATCNLQGKG